jgi:hypothetical protein
LLRYASASGMARPCSRPARRRISQGISSCGRRAPVLPEAGQSHQAAIGEGNGVGLFAGGGLLPLIEVIDRNEAAAALEGVTERWPILDPSAFALMFAKPTLRSLAQYGTRPHETAHGYDQHGGSATYGWLERVRTRLAPGGKRIRTAGPTCDRDATRGTDRIPTRRWRRARSASVSSWFGALAPSRSGTR